jgi:hypothetical protein
MGCGWAVENNFPQRLKPALILLRFGPTDVGPFQNLDWAEFFRNL